ncbi:unnamed protein product [Ceratitis capitata]|uniref:(Mediterranean fruit fly) hypothetical protein n=1 Tax=Ceratitis capitata TaxID=7213 RepID=A0A811UUW7_CERCA|nr:unnamed protein product [Ceratitis capitata]
MWQSANFKAHTNGSPFNKAHTKDQRAESINQSEETASQAGRRAARAGRRRGYTMRIQLLSASSLDISDEEVHIIEADENDIQPAVNEIPSSRSPPNFRPSLSRIRLPIQKVSTITPKRNSNEQAQQKRRRKQQHSQNLSISRPTISVKVFGAEKCRLLRAKKSTISHDLAHQLHALSRGRYET